MQLVLANLLSNAGRHTPDCSAPPSPWGWRAGRAEAGSPGVSVTDDGPGIPAELEPSLFRRRFVRGATHPGPGAAGSIGLGLAIVDAVVGAHGGTAMAVASQRGRTRLHHHPARSWMTGRRSAPERGRGGGRGGGDEPVDDRTRPTAASSTPPATPRMARASTSCGASDGRGQRLHPADQEDRNGGQEPTHQKRAGPGGGWRAPHAPRSSTRSAARRPAGWRGRGGETSRARPMTTRTALTTRGRKGRQGDQWARGRGSVGRTGRDRRGDRPSLGDDGCQDERQAFDGVCWPGGQHVGDGQDDGREDPRGLLGGRWGVARMRRACRGWPGRPGRPRLRPRGYWRDSLLSAPPYRHFPHRAYAPDQAG